MLVVVSHAGLEKHVPGAAGVTVFLAISGFIITYLVARERVATGGFSAASFYLRRALKIGPPLIAIIIVPTFVLAALGGDVSLGVLASQAFFSYNWVAVYAHDPVGVLPGSGVLWSLSVEEQFYIVFALFWIFASRHRYFLRYAAAFGAVAIVASFVSRVLISAAPGNGSIRINYGTDTRMESIGWGVLTAVLYIGWQRREDWLRRLRAVVTHPLVPVVVTLVFVGTLALREPWFRDTVRYTLQSLSACLFILFGLLGRGRTHDAVIRLSRWRPVWLIGLASYSIYLVHQALYFAMDALLGTTTTAALAPLYIPIGVLGGIVIYRLVEVPFENVRAALHRSREELPAADETAAEPASSRADGATSRAQATRAAPDTHCSQYQA
jgi:peptidoglycan/LPS O-acetylase OafA/YrhL